jgi:hypothetical protein
MRDQSCVPRENPHRNVRNETSAALVRVLGDQVVAISCVVPARRELGEISRDAA